ncbi:MAG: chromate transporter [Lachnospiraceae bacterium]|nr:chromate transporter [Lachnospiraceae bacterium]
MKEKRQGLSFYWKLFKSTFLISLFTFGGGYVMVTLMQRKFVNEYKWFEEDEMLDLIAIATSCPGPIAVNASILVGYKMGRVPGAIVTVVGTVIPPMAVVAVISVIYSAIKDNSIVALVLKGMRIGVAAVMVDVVIGMLSTIIKKKSILAIGIFVVAFIAQAFFDVNVILIIIVAAAIGAATMLGGRKNKDGKGAKE